jgi:transposase
MVQRHALTDEQWTKLAPLLPPERPATGRPNRPHRLILDAILWRLTTGSQWRDLPERFGSWQTAYSRFRRWQQAGIWDQILAALQADADAHGELDWSLHFMDGTIVRAHPDAAGAQKGGPMPTPTRPSGAPRAASRPRSTCAPTAQGSRSLGS